MVECGHPHIWIANSAVYCTPPHTALENATLVIWDKREQALSTCTVIYLCASPHKGISWQSADVVTPIFGNVC